MPATPLNEVLGRLVGSADARASFEADPEQYLAAEGHQGIAPGELREAFGVMADGVPTVDSAALMETTDFVDTVVASFDEVDPFDAGEFGSGAALETSEVLEEGEESLEELDSDFETEASSEEPPDWEPDLGSEPDADTDFGQGEPEPTDEPDFGEDDVEDLDAF